MPAKHSLKDFVSDSFYHIYNRGVEKQPIFRDDQDYRVLLSYLKTYLEPKDEVGLRKILTDSSASWRDKDQATKLLRLNNFSDSINLLSYCLMKNHFHFLIKQSDASAMDKFMNSLFTRYTMYFNKKYKRVGPLFQGVYKAVLVGTDEQLIYLTRYIHRNIIASRRKIDLASQGDALRSWYSSYLEYLGKRKTKWVKPGEILSFFSKSKLGSYESFIEVNDHDEMQYIRVGKLMIDEYK